jgi:hypothetical protein
MYAFLIRRLVPSHQPPVTMAALTGFICVHASAGARRTFGPVLRVRAPGNSPAAGHPGGVGNETHDGSFDGTGVGATASHAASDRTEFLENVIHLGKVALSTPGMYKIPEYTAIFGPGGTMQRRE